MGLFGPKKLSLDEIIKGIEKLSDEDKVRLNSYLTPEENEAPESDVNEDVDTDTPAKEDAAPEAEDPEAVPDDDTNVGEEPEVTADEGEDAAENDAPEAEPEAEEGTENEAEEAPEAPVAPAAPLPDYEALFAAYEAKFDALNELVANLTERCNALTEAVDTRPFGNQSPGMPSGDIEEENGVSPTMRSYTKKQVYR